ncbi:MAG: transcriptional repressor [Bacteroidales bacterium]|nr:transcriptional repressor [Bacteroidales bacterium]
MKTSLKILEKYNLVKTQARLDILDIFTEKSAALSEGEIEDSLCGSCDRATIYRTLNLFTLKGILHEIANGSTIRKYTLKKKPERHLHFECNLCGEIVCLTGISLPDYRLPEGFTEQEAHFLIKGICKACYEA